jgi:hypothetical protein
MNKNSGNTSSNALLRLRRLARARLTLRGTPSVVIISPAAFWLLVGF